MSAGLRLSSTAFLGMSAAFVPPSLANVVFWGRADDLGSVDGTLISSFTDLSGNANHATAATTARPTLKTAIVNSHNVLRFNGTANKMDWPNMLAAATSGELFVVMKAAADPGVLNKTCPWVLNGTGGSEAAHPFTTGNVHEHFGSGTGLITSVKPSTAAAFHIYNVQTSSNQMILRWNGETFCGLNKLTAGFVTALKLGANVANSVFMDGDVAEILIYNTTLSTSDRALVHAYLSTRDSISVTNVATTYSPSDFSGLQAWYKADSLSLNDADPVSTWTDQSGNSRTLTGTLTTRPLYKTNIYNGQPIVRYDGTDDTMILGADLTLSTTFTTIIIGKCTKNDSALLFGGLGDHMRLRRGGANQMNFFNGAEVTSTSSWNYALGDLNMFAATRNGSNSVVFYQGTEASVGGTRGTAFVERYVGSPAAGALVYGGDVGEVCIWNTTLSPSDLAKLYYTYFKPKWGLP